MVTGGRAAVVSDHFFGSSRKKRRLNLIGAQANLESSSWTRKYPLFYSVGASDLGSANSISELNFRTLNSMVAATSTSDFGRSETVKQEDPGVLAGIFKSSHRLFCTFANPIEATQCTRMGRCRVIHATPADGEMMDSGVMCASVCGDLRYLDPGHLAKVSKCVAQLTKRAAAAADTSSAGEKKESDDNARAALRARISERDRSQPST